jgi:2-hydroxychromene-2-carboxylate isomerase
MLAPVCKCCGIAQHICIPLRKQTTGNKPPWTLPAKKSYGAFETKRAQKYFGVPDIPTPKFFPILSILVRRRSSALHSAQLS